MKTLKRLLIIILVILFMLSLMLNVRYYVMNDFLSKQLNQTLKQTQQLEKDYKLLQNEVSDIKLEKEKLSMQIDNLQDQQVKMATDIKKEQIKSIVENKEEIKSEVKENDFGKKVIGWGIGALTIIKSVVPFVIPAL